MRGRLAGEKGTIGGHGDHGDGNVALLLLPERDPDDVEVAQRQSYPSDPDESNTNHDN